MLQKIGAMLTALLLSIIALSPHTARALPKPSADEVEPPPLGEKAQPGPVVKFAYRGRWEYRFGDSPRTDSGKLAWAQPLAEGTVEHPGWQETGPFVRLPDRNGNNFLWVRTRLSGPPLRDGVVYLSNVDNLLEAYLDGQLVYRFGDLSGTPPFRFIGFRSHFIPLDANYQGRTLALRIYSNLRNIGPFGEPRLGERAEIISDIFAEDQIRLVIGVMLLLIGISSMGLYILRREERAYLLYGCFGLCMGIYICTQLQVRVLLVNHPLVWVHVEIAALYLSAIFICAYLEQIFGRGPLGLARILTLLNCAFVLCAFLAVAILRVIVWRTLFPFQVLVLIDASILTLSTLYAALRGNIEARIFFAGFLIAASIATFDILAAMRLVPRTRLNNTHLGNTAVTLALGAILARRFVLVHKRLRDYSSVLQLSLSNVSAFEPEERMLVALDELIRMLGAQRALLFLCQPGTEDLEFTVGRDQKKQTLTSAEHVDQRIVDQARERHKPTSLQTGPQRRSQIIKIDRKKRNRPSSMAAPLLARGELLGVIYLEGEGERRGFQEDDLTLLLGLATQVAITILDGRAIKLELDNALTRQRYEEQRALLDAAVRMASGDLTTPIKVPKGSGNQHLAAALDAMRRDLWAKVEMLETRTHEIQTLNDELRHQIEQRSRRLMSTIMQRKGGNAAPLGQLETGKILVGRYRVRRQIGRGAMGQVYEVERTSDHKLLAAKLLSIRADRPSLLRFTREAQILARLSHKNLIAISDIDMTAGGVLFIVLELVSGGALTDRRARFGQVRWALCVLRQMSDALAAIHEAGIVHRDLKPGNVLIATEKDDDRPLIKLADFGVSLLTIEGSGPTAIGPVRISPEALRQPIGSVPMAAAASNENWMLSHDNLDAVVAAPGFGDEEEPETSPVVLTTPSPVSINPFALLDATTEVLGAAGEKRTIAAPSDVPPVASGRDARAASLAALDAKTLNKQDELLAPAPEDTGMVTQTGLLIGTPMYMAPELWNSGSHEAQPPSDIFSFGVIAFELLTGGMPFVIPPVTLRANSEPLAIMRLSDLRSDLDPQLCALCDRCLDPDPDKRPTAQQIMRQLIELGAPPPQG